MQSGSISYRGQPYCCNQRACVDRKGRAVRHRDRDDGNAGGLCHDAPEPSELVWNGELESLRARVERHIEIVIGIIDSGTVEKHPDGFSPWGVPVLGCHSFCVVSIPADGLLKKPPLAEHGVSLPEIDEPFY